MAVQKFLTLTGLSTVFTQIKNQIASALSPYIKTADADKKYLTSSSLSSYAQKTYVDTKISDLVGGAPETLDTLKEISTALGNDANLSATLTAEIGKKANSGDVYSKTQADSTFAKSADITAITETEITTAATSVFSAA